MKTLAEHNLRWGSLKPSNNVMTSPWWGALTEREQDCLLFAIRKAGDQAISVDLSQAINRLRFASEFQADPVVPTMMAGTRFWVGGKDTDSSGEKNVLCHPIDHFVFQGWPYALVDEDYIASLEPSFLRDLAGNMYPPPMMLAFAMAAIFTCDIRPPKDG